MNIIFFRHSLLSRGGDKMIVIYANYLAASGHIVTIKTNVLDTVFTLDERISVQPLRYAGKFGSILSAVFEKTSADILVADIIAMVCLLSLRNRFKLVCFAQDYDESYYSNVFQKLLIRILYYIGLTFCKIKTIAVSSPLTELLRCRFNADVCTVENGIDTDVFFVDPDFELLRMKEGRKSVLLLSRKDYRKGFDVAVRVINQLSKQQIVPIEVWTVGIPVQQLLTNCVHRDFGYVGEVELRRIMSCADIFLYPSRHEGLPLMPLEAMACGCAVVTTTAVPFAVHGENALVAPIDDCETLTRHLTTLLSEELLRIRLVDAGKQTVLKHKLSEASQQFETALFEFFQKLGP